jgi:CRP-like cAMP-binding protein
MDAPKVRILRALKLCALFEPVSRETLEEAVAAADIEVVSPGSTIVTQDERATAVVILGSGRARLERKVGAQTVVPLGYRGLGEVVGEACLVASVAAYGESAVAMDESEVVRLPVAAAQRFLREDPGLGAALLQLLLARQREMEDRIESLLFRNVEGRLVEFLLKAAARWGVSDPKGTMISAPITHFEIAQSIGSTRETVTITLGQLRREGLLDVSGRRIIVVDAVALAKR